MRDLKMRVLPRCFPFQVTVSLRFTRPVVTPATASSRVWAIDFLWRSMLRARSNTRSIGAAIKVVKWMVGISRVIWIRSRILKDYSDFADKYAKMIPNLLNG